jgi:general nucleoside transport system ATP-binding protein
MTAAPDYLLEAIDIVKVFGTLRANDGVTLRVAQGEIHALLGENGAGKSTLVKMIYGALRPTSGTLKWLGQVVEIPNPNAARKLGIGMVFQHFSLFDALSVVENISLALPGKFDLAALAEKVGRVSKEYGLPLNPSATVADLSVGERQRIEIVRCLLQEPKLLILDEPTAVLTPQEADQLFVTLKRLASEGCSVLYISHRLEEVKRLCHAATILRQGRVVASCDPTKETAASLAKLMVGGDVHAVRAAKAPVRGDYRFSLHGANLAADGPFAVELKNVSLDVRGGEVVAIAGVAGNGQTELFDAISGERVVSDDSSVLIDGKPVGASGVIARRKMGAAFVPEERLGHGAVPTLPLTENVVLTRHSDDLSLANRGIVDRKKAGSVAERVVKTFDVRKGKPDPEARSLSGGNLQKFLMGRELDRKPKVLVVNQPTWGVDAGAAATVRQALIDLARSGSAVVVISQDLDEIFELADRIAVISRGELSEAFPAHEMTAEKIGLLMAGAHERKAEGHAAHS